MAEHLVAVFGKRLVLPPDAKFVELPRKLSDRSLRVVPRDAHEPRGPDLSRASPHSLRGRVIIKGKRQGIELRKDEDDSDDSDDASVGPEDACRPSARTSGADAHADASSLRTSAADEREATDEREAVDEPRAPSTAKAKAGKPNPRSNEPKAVSFHPGSSRESSAEDSNRRTPRADTTARKSVSIRKSVSRRNSAAPRPQGEKKVSDELSLLTGMHATKFGGFKSMGSEVVEEESMRAATLGKGLIASSFKESVRRAASPPMASPTGVATSPARLLSLCGLPQHSAAACHSNSRCRYRGAELDKQRPRWIHHNKRLLSRIYPKGSRTDSSNLPEALTCRMWSAGVQMVALNWQTWDDAMLLNRALFSLNGGVGYVLKPAALIDDASAHPERFPPPLRSSRPFECTDSERFSDASSNVSPRCLTADEAAASTASTFGEQDADADANDDRGSSSGRRRGGAPPVLPSGASTSSASAPAPAENAPRPPPIILGVRVLAAFNLPKTTDERVLPEAWDEFPGNSGYWNGARLGYFPQVNFEPDRTPVASGIVSAACDIEVVGGYVGEEGSDAADERFVKHTSVASNNGLNPSWPADDHPCHVAVWAPEQSFLKISVHNARAANMTTLGGFIGGLVGQTRRVLLAHEAVPVSALRPGYRSLQLRSPACGNLIESCALLLHVSITPMAADVMLPPPPRSFLGETRSAPSSYLNNFSRASFYPSLGDRKASSWEPPPTPLPPKLTASTERVSGLSDSIVHEGQNRARRRSSVMLDAPPSVISEAVHEDAISEASHEGVLLPASERDVQRRV